ncbi:2-polyprenyl-6-methoxyphenol hydroxylase-like FAD-dependent oxidoreductase [Catenulispora sp. EB89]|uniref:FAD-dependent monooxygenase n=1 Tax=Catenulispora sp. EB89 TaxID=3156257 RepID=UPI003510F0D3
MSSPPDIEVLVVGAGPVGCWVAAELCAAGVRVMVVEARENRAAWSRGFVVHPRTLEIFDSRGAAAPMVATSRRVPTWHFAMGASRLDFAVLPTSFPHILLQPQAQTEEMLETHLNRCGGEVLRGRRVVDVRQQDDRVVATVRHDGAEQTVGARFVVGCDGAHSAVREAAGIGFSGTPDTLLSPAALVELKDPPPPEQYMQGNEQGLLFVIPLPDGRFVVSTIDHAVMTDLSKPWTAETVRESLIRITGTDYGLGEVERVSTIGNSASQADRYRDGRVLLAGDAAHVHFPMGGQGMNLGIQDAHNLAWRLIAAVRAERDGSVPDTVDELLDGYEAERRPAGERVLEDVHAQMGLVAATGADGAALRARFEALLAEHPEVNLQYARRLSGIAVRYPTAQDGKDGNDAEDARLGARVPDLLLERDAAPPVRLYELLREIGPGRFVRLTVGGPAVGTDDADDGAALIAATAVAGPAWALRDGWDAPGSVLIRPDGHVAEARTW